MMGEAQRICGRCGQALAPNAAFCRRCGTRYEEPVSPPLAFSVSTAPASPPAPDRRRISGPLLFLVLAIVAVAGAVGTVLLLDGGSSTTTTVVTVDQPPTGSSEASGSSAAESAEGEVGKAAPVAIPESSPGTIAAGRYVQAGSFKFAGDAEEEQSRLAVDGIEVEVVPSEEAQELYPGFEVLLDGPFRSIAAERSQLRRLRHDGVPSAFVRALTPAGSAAPSELGGGTWTGRLEESSTSRPQLDRSLRATFAASAAGTFVRLTIAAPSCVVELRAERPTGAGLRYRSSSGCFSGTWRVRPDEGVLMVSLVPMGSDSIVLGELH